MEQIEFETNRVRDDASVPVNAGDWAPRSDLQFTARKEDGGLWAWQCDSGGEGVRFGALVSMIRQVGVGPQWRLCGPRLSGGVGRVVARGLA